MKKLLKFVSLCTVAIISLTACQTTPKDATPTTNAPAASGAEAPKDAAASSVLTFSWWGNQTRNERTQAALELYTKENPNITFDGQFSEWNDYWNKLATSSAGNSLPDLVQMDYKFLKQYVGNNLLVDLKPYIDDGTLDVSGISPGILEAGSIDGKVYSIAIGVNAPALLYNKTLLEKNDIKIKDNMTIKEFTDVCKQVYEKTGYKTNLGYNNGENLIEYLLRGDGYVLTEEGKLGVPNAEALEPYFNLYEQGKKEGWHVDVSVFAERTVGSVEQETLVYGNSPETMSWCATYYSNQLSAMQKAAPEGMEIGITTWPSDNVKASNYLKPGQFLSVSAHSKNPKEAVKVLDYWTNSVECNDILLAERGVPASSVVAEAIAPKLDEINNNVITYINDVVTETSSAISPPAPEGSAEVFQLIKQLEENLMYGKMTPKEAASELFEKGNAFLAAKAQ